MKIKILIILLIFGIVACQEKSITVILYDQVIKLEAQAVIDAQIAKAQIDELKNDLAIEKEIIGIITCESGGYHDELWGDKGKSYGVAQWQLKTFKYIKKLANMPKLKWKSQADQITLLRWSLKNGYGKYWTCHSEVKKKAVKKAKLLKKQKKAMKRLIPAIASPTPPLEESFWGVGF